MTWPEKDRRKGPIEATVVGASANASAIPALVVGDKRDFFGKRLGAFALALLILFFVVSGYIQSARNGVLLERASRDRSDLISSLEAATTTIEQQSVDLADLRRALSEQNKLLRDAGLPTVNITDGEPRQIPAPQPSPTPSGQVRSNSPIRDSPKPVPGVTATPIVVTPRPDPSPTPSPSPSPTATQPVPIVRDILCTLTGAFCNRGVL